MRDMQFLRKFHRALLNFYPKGYREEYGEELQAVFDLSYDDAVKAGKLEVARVFLRELIGLPGAVIYEHLRERRQWMMTGKFASRFDFPQGSKSEFLAVLASFMIPMAVILFFRAVINYFGAVPAETLWLNILFAVFFFGSFLGMFAAGLIVGVPRWFLPYFGSILALINIYAHGLIDPNWRGFPSLYLAPRFLRAFVYEGLFWAGLIILVILLVLFAALIPRFHHFYWRLRDDWSLLAFIVYGATPLALYFTFDDYQGEAPYVLTAYFVLAVGGWLYLRNQIMWKRFLPLFIGLALCMAVAAAGKWILFTPRPGFGFTKWSEMMGTVITWIWLALIILLPLAINLLPRSKIMQTT